jgi:hypothetical protein
MGAAVVALVASYGQDAKLSTGFSVRCYMSGIGVGRRGLLAFVALVLAAGWFAAAAPAATYTVGTTSDLTGTCQSPVSGKCSLRQLITYENNLPTTPNPVDTIVVPASANFYFLSNGAILIDQSVTIAGGGARATTVFQNTTSGSSRVFNIQIPEAGSAPNVVISGLTIADGKADDTNSDFGGDIRNEATLTLNQDEITDGTAASGAGISNEGGKLTVSHSLIDNNHANIGGADSGGIQNFGPNPVTGGAAALFVDNSTIANNTSNLGGGIFSWCSGTNGACSTSGATNTATITNSTIAGNDGGARSTTGGGLLVSSGTISVQNSIIAKNTVRTGAAQSNCGGTIKSLGHNLDSGASCGFTGGGDLQNTDPQFLTALATDNGGNTDTLALRATSPAVDAIPSSGSGCAGTDQRAVPRPQGFGCDLGAFELFQPTEGTQFTEVVGSIEAAARSFTINWGDGTAGSSGTLDRATGQVTGTHTYADEGIYHGVINYTNSDGIASTTPFDVKVTDAPLIATGASLSLNAGAPFSGQVATFTHALPAGTTSDYTATINWGDGTASAGTVGGSSAGFEVSGAHAYSHAGSFGTTISIADRGGATATAHGTAVVRAAPSPVVTGPPRVVGSSGAVFSGSVDPEGLPTSAHFEYGLDARYTAGAGTVYDQSTPSLGVGSDFSTHAVSASVSGLLPNALYHVRLVAGNGAGSATGPDRTFTTRRDPLPPAPVIGKSVNAAPVSGVVFIKPPEGKSLGKAADARAANSTPLVKGKGFVPLTETRQIPIGSQIDARRGTLKLVTASQRRGKTQFGTFGSALFGISQIRNGLHKGLTTLSLLEGDFFGAPTYASCQAHTATDNSAPTAHAALSRRILQTLHSHVSGRFRTRGRYSAGTVRGTIWDTTDRCDGTLTVVHRGTVDVTDFQRRKTIAIHAGHSYLARAIKQRRHK